MMEYCGYAHLIWWHVTKHAVKNLSESLGIIVQDDLESIESILSFDTKIFARISPYFHHISSYYIYNIK